jgi:hypothetical protein
MEDSLPPKHPWIIHTTKYIFTLKENHITRQSYQPNIRMLTQSRTTKVHVQVGPLFGSLAVIDYAPGLD